MSWDSLLRLIRPYRRPLGACVALMLLESLAWLVAPWIGGRIAAGLFGAGAASVDLLAPLLLVLLAAQTALRILRVQLVERTSLIFISDLRRRLYDHLQRLPMTFFDRRRKADLLSMLTWEAEVLNQFVTGTLLAFLPGLLTLVGAVAVMIWIDAVLALPVVLGIPLFVLMAKIVGRRLRPLSVRLREANAAVFDVEAANLDIIPAIKSFAREDLESARHKARLEEYLQLNLRLARIQSSLGPLASYVAAAAVILVLWLASGAVRSGEMSAGALVAFLLYAALLTRPVAAMANAWAAYQHAKRVMGHMEEVLETAPEPSGPRTLGRVRGRIEAERLRFAHPGRPPLFRDVSLTIEAGSIVALTGPNGAGKSTFVDLLMRLYVPDAGRIMLDGNDLAELDLAQLRRTVAFVPQDPMLTGGTVEDNVRFGKPDASAQDIEAALGRAQARAFVDALPEGARTRIGDRGVRLSGGQRQRLALARALLKNPAVLILDEPTAMFDPEGERAFVEDARRTLAGKTVILITHRPASLALADRILRLEDGRIEDITPMQDARHA